MAYESIVAPHEPIYSDGMNAPPQAVTIGGVEMGMGYEPRDWYAMPFGSMPFSAVFDLPTVPRDEWDDRIQEMESTNNRLSDRVRAAGIKVKQQQSTNYCWAFATVSAIEVARASQNQAYVPLSPASVAAPITRYRNVGGWGSMALEKIVADGVVPTELWPDTAINRTYATRESDEARQRYKCIEWWEIDSRNFDQLMSCLFYRIPVSCGYNHWRHQVMVVDPVRVDGKYGVRFINSWGESWGDRGSGILLGNKAIADDATAPRVVTPS